MSPAESMLSSGAADGADAVLIAVLRDVGQGDRAAFERLYRLTSVKLFAICRRIISAPHDAEEALQNAYLNIWRHAGAYDSARGRPMTWLINIAHRAAIDVLRRRRSSGENVPLDLDVGGVAAAGDPAASARLATCLRALDRQDEAMLRRAFYEGATYAEIAGLVSSPLGTVKSRIRRALLKLAECLR